MPGHTYFANNLPKKEHWRAYKEFRENTIFLDIETTGLSPYYNEITMIGIHGSDGTKVIINGIDLEDLPQALEGYKVIVTFNRARFDLPFIEQHLPDVSFTQLHIDLLYPLHRPGLTRGPNVSRPSWDFQGLAKPLVCQVSMQCDCGTSTNVAARQRRTNNAINEHLQS